MTSRHAQCRSEESDQAGRRREGSGRREVRAERGDGSRFYTDDEREDAVTKRVGHQNLISNFPRHFQVFHIVAVDSAFVHSGTRRHDEFRTMQVTGLRSGG
jgi:hypothetical protein